MSDAMTEPELLTLKFVEEIAVVVVRTYATPPPTYVPIALLVTVNCVAVADATVASVRL
jgi:hypothetical protein